METWALEEIGRNSVRPWTTPRTMASSQFIGDFLSGAGPRRGGTATFGIVDPPAVSGIIGNAPAAGSGGTLV